MNREKIQFRIDYDCPLKKVLLYCHYKSELIDTCVKCKQYDMNCLHTSGCKILGKNFNWFEANWWEDFIKQGQLIILEEIEI